MQLWKPHTVQVSLTMLRSFHPSQYESASLLILAFSQSGTEAVRIARVVVVEVAIVVDIPHITRRVGP